ETGSNADNDAVWTNVNESLAAHAGKTIYIYIEAADLGAGSKTEVGIDDITVRICAEICDNGQDDDGDGAVDELDADCIIVCPTGSLTVERFLGISGTAVSDLTGSANYPNSPDETFEINSFDGPDNYASDFGTRVRGYITPSETGNYIFNVTGDDDIELYLSTDASASSSSLIASISGWTNVTDHTKYASQTSASINLVAGQSYYVELLHKEGGGGDHFQVYWQTPSNNSWTIIPGANLSPFTCESTCDNVTDAGAITGDEVDCAGYDASEITETTAATGGAGALEYQWESSTDNATFTEISGANAANYNPGAINVTTYFRRKARRAGCDNTQWLVSNVVTKTAEDNLTNAGTIAADEADCGAFDPAIITSAAPPSGGQGGSFKYEWQSSTDGSTWTDIANTDTEDYNPTNISVTTYYRRGARRANCDNFLYSNVVVKTIIENVTDAGTVSGDESDCGSYDPANITATSPTGGSSVAAEYQWQSSTDNVTFTDISGATSATYNPTTINETTYFRRGARRASCSAYVYSNAVLKEVVESYTNGGTIAGDETNCATYDPAVITASNAPNGGTGGAVQYQWQSSTDNVNFTDISGATSATYDPTTISETTYYRRGARRANCDVYVYSNTVQKESTSNYTDAGSIDGDESDCGSYDPSVINSTNLPSGGSNGSAQYQWQSSTDNVNFTDIGGATSATYDPTTINETTYYRRATKRSICADWIYSDAAEKVVIISLTDAGAIAADENDCPGYDPAEITETTAASGGVGGTVSYQWQSSIDDATWADIDGATAANYDPATTEVTTFYRRGARRAACEDFIYTSSVEKAVDRRVSPDAFSAFCPGLPYENNVLFNDLNFGGSYTLTVTQQPTEGTLNLNQNGSFTFTPNSIECFVDRFTYEVCYNGGSCCETAEVTVSYADDTPPQLLNVPEDDVVFCDEVVPAVPFVQIFDNCPAISLAVNESDSQGEDGCSLHDYTITRTWTATDACGNQTLDTQIVQVMDATAPDIYRIYYLPNGKRMVAGVMENVTERWKTIQLPIDFANKPLIFNQLTSDNEASAAVVQMRNISISQFEMRLTEEAGNDGDHQPENVAWIAIEEGAYTTNFEAVKTTLDEAWKSINFTQSYSAAPALLTTTQTTKDAEATSIRYRNLNANNVELYLQEETSTDADASHTTEDVGYFAIGNTGDFLDANSQVMGENGSINATQLWTTVTFSNTYYNPVVIANSLSNNQADAATVRVRNVTNTGFEVRVEEWDYQDGIHLLEEVHWMVVEGSLPLVTTADCDAVPNAPIGGIQIIAVDNCDISVPLNYNEIEDYSDCDNRFITRSWEATDECGNTTVYTKTIIVSDPINPTFTLPADVTIGCNDDPTDLSLTGNVTNMVDNCSTNLSAFYTDDVSSISSCNQSGLILRTWRVSDECGNSSELTQTITIDDSDCEGCDIYVNTTDDIDDGECTHEHCSLREAINESNESAGLDTIRFLIPGTGVQTIIPLSPLPTVTEEVFIDATTQPEASCPDNLLVELDGTLLTGNASGLEILADNVTLKGFVINRFPGNGITFGEVNMGHVQCSYVGINANGTVARANALNGIQINAGASNIIIGSNEDGTDDELERNVISGNTQSGIQLNAATNNKVAGNHLGTDKDGVNPVPNLEFGVEVTGSSTDNQIGGQTDLTGNIISGNAQSGIYIGATHRGFTEGNLPVNNLIQHNRIGWSANNTPLGNSENGIVIELANDIQITDNRIATNGENGIQVNGAKAIVTDNLIQDNGESGIVFGTHYGSDSDPENEASSPDDILPLVSISSNTFNTNCTNATPNTAEVLALDVPLAPVQNDNGLTIYNDNDFTNSSATALLQLWYGAVEFIQNDRPAVAPFAVIIESENNGPTYDLDAAMTMGGGFRKTILHGESGAAKDDVKTWTQFVEYTVAADGSTMNYSPFSTTECDNIFSFDGDATTHAVGFDLGYIGEGLETTSPATFGTTYSVNRYQIAQLEDCSDRDSDGSVDDVDLDDDNDGIADVDEGEGDADGDGIPNNLDLDSDNDGIPDIIEAGFKDQNGDGLVDNLGLPGWDDDKDGWADGFDANDRDPSLSASDQYEPTSFEADRDGDGLPNYQDLDSDNDGLPDLIEAGGVDTNGDGQVDYQVVTDPNTMLDNDGDGFTDLYDPDYNGSPGADDTSLPLVIYGGTVYADAQGKVCDADGDMIPNFWDLDSDNDGIPDLIEQGGVDTDGNGEIDPAEWVDANSNGFQDNYENFPLITTEGDDGAGNVRPVDSDNNGSTYASGDMDNDDLPNAYDNEADGDGRNDLREIASPTADTDNDGKVDGFTDANNNGFDDNLESTPLVFTETDGIADNGKPEDSIDADASSFGTSVIEGTLGLVDNEPDVDNDGDGQLNSLDLDSDNDLILDNVEDTNQDVTVDAGETDPYNTDSDADFISDGVEDLNQNGEYDPGLETDALDPDTDGDTLLDGIEDDNVNGFVDGIESDPRDPCDPILSAQCIGVSLSLRAHLYGPLSDSPDGLMRDDLRQKGYLPLEEPYSDMQTFEHQGDGGGEVTTQDVFDITGNDAIVDWVFVELRSPLDSTQVIGTRSALLQRDGDVVDVDGVSPLTFWTMVAGSYYVSIRHRNHLGICTSVPQVMTKTTSMVDFIEPTTKIFGEHSRIKVEDKWALWAGDLSKDGKVIFQGPQNDIFNMLVKVLSDEQNDQQYYNYIIKGYHGEDFDLDGDVIYQGPDNDRSKVLFDIILRFPTNHNGFPNFIINSPNPR
ncbi:MAG: PA14 domain-containing protein, partial [Saprospiraceae bacterium]